MKKFIHLNQSDFLGARKLLLCLLVFLPLLNYGQTTATESFEGETTFNVYDNAFSESGINFEVTGTRMRVAWGQGFGSNGSAVYFETTTLINHSNQNIGGFRITNAATSFKINSFACWTSNDINLLVHNSGTVTFIGTKPDGTTVSATRNIVPLPNGLDYHEGITFAGTALENVQLTKLEFQLPSNLLYFSIDNINFTTAPVVSSQYSINDVSAIEANSGTNTHTFTVSRTNSSATGSVTLNTANGTATSGVDYTAISNQVVNFAIGELTKTVNVTVNGDVSLEPNETYFVNLTSPVGGTLLDAQGVGNILDDDAVTETFEGETNGGATFSQNGISFSATQDLKVYTAATFGSGSSNSWLHSTIGNGGNAASTGKINITTGNRAIKLISFDAWTSNADGNNGFATGVVRLIGTKLDGTTVQADFTVTPTDNTGTGWQQNISFASTPFNNQMIKAIELVVVSGINYISVDNIKFSSEILAPEIDVVDAGNVAIANGSNTASASNNTQFGNICAAGTGSISKTYTIKNTDTFGTLNLSGSPLVSITGADASSFSVSTQPNATVNPSGSTTFTVAFDPTSAGAKNATISIANDDANENPYTFAIQGTGNASISATFNAVNPICSGATLAPLPTTSTNNITGTWSPALSNTASGTYTFTPTAGQCTTGTSSLSVTVNPLVTATFNAVNPICSGETLAPLPTTSTNGVTGTWSPALSNTATGTYTFTPTAGQCTTGTSSLSVTVKPFVTATFNAVNPICSGATLAPLPTTSTNSITGTWSPALSNTASGTYTFTPTAGQCTTGTSSLSVTVKPFVTATFNAVNPICSGTTLAPLPTTSTNGVTGTWSPALSNTASGTYTFTPTAGQCTTGTSSLSVTVKSSVSKAHVNNAVTVSGDGLSWATAFKNLQEGLNACSVTEVWVAEGKYLPTEDEFGNSSPIDVRSKTFMMKNGANVFGGFPALGNPVIGDRNPKDYVTTLSGDFNNDDVVTGTGATLNIANNSENAYHVVAVGESITAITQINGLTIEGGNADDLDFISFLNLPSGFDGQNGGAVFLANNPAEFQIKNCILKNNSAFEYGGAIYSASSSNLNLTESVLTNNKANYGSGIYTYQNTALDISKSVMIGNLANISASAMFFTFGNNNVVSNTDILNNHVSVFEGSVCAATLASATIVNSIIWGNTGDDNTSLEEFFGGAFDIQYSDIEGSGVYPGVNNVLLNPGFKNANNPTGDDGKWLTADDGLMLKTCSPLVDVALDYHPTDILGNPMVDVLTVGGASITDIGAYESQIANIYSLLMDTDSLSQDVNNNVFVNSDCELAAKILPIGGSTAVNSDVKVKVFVSATSSPNYLRRHYEITPTVNPNTATASVTLYFTQADFDAYNVSNALKLPTGPTDGLNKLNLKIVKFSGVSSNGFPSGYPSEPVTIIPDTSKIVWNGAYWSVTFDVAGFSGFFVNTPSAAPLSASLASFTAKKNSSKSNILVWNVTNETDFKGYEIEKSTDGKLFEKVGFVQANHSPSYKFVDNNVSANANYYRLKMINTNETWVHSRIEYVENGTENTKVSQVYPNPVSGKQIRIDIESNEDKILQTQIVDILGMQYLAKDIKVQAGNNKVMIDLPNLLSKIYFIRLKDQSGKEFVRKFSLK